MRVIYLIILIESKFAIGKGVVAKLRRNRNIKCVVSEATGVSPAAARATFADGALYRPRPRNTSTRTASTSTQYTAM